MRVRLLIAVTPLMYLIGCAMTEEQIKQVGDAVKTGVQGVVTPLVSVAAPGMDAGAAAGIASALGLGVAYGVMALIRVFNKKPSV